MQGRKSRGMQDKGREGSARAKGAQQKQHPNKDTDVFISYISVYTESTKTASLGMYYVSL